MTTKYYPVTPLNFREEVRVDTNGDEVSVTVYSVDMKHIDLLIQTLENVKSEYAIKSPIIVDEPPQMTAVLGAKPDPTGWYKNALQKASTENFTPALVPTPKAQERKYFTCAETATFVREALKKAYPAHKFSVRSKTYSGGASIDIRWVDGLTEYEVNQVVSRFSGATFDGMQDLKEYVSHEDENGADVHYGADFIFCNRDYSRDVTQKLAEQIAKFEGIELPEMNKYDWFDNDIRLDCGEYFTTRLNQARFCYSITEGKYVGGRDGYLPQWIECMISI